MMMMTNVFFLLSARQYSWNTNRGLDSGLLYTADSQFQHRSPGKTYIITFDKYKIYYLVTKGHVIGPLDPVVYIVHF